MSAEIVTTSCLELSSLADHNTAADDEPSWESSSSIRFCWRAQALRSGLRSRHRAAAPLLGGEIVGTTCAGSVSRAEQTESVVIASLELCLLIGVPLALAQDPIE